MKRFVCVWLTLIGAATALLAADFWQTKQFSQWSDKEVRRMLEDSPWAHRVSVVLMGRPGFSPGAGGGAGGGGGGGGRGGRGRGGDGGALGESELARPTLPLVVQWVSALPLKQALVRSSMSSEQEMDDATRQFLDRAETHYVVAVSGIPARMARLSEGAGRFAKTSRVERGNNGEALTPEKVEARPEHNQVTLYFLFSRADPITAAHRNVEFIFKLANLEVKSKFKLQNMMYGGKLEL